MNNLSITISVIVAVCAIISPILTAIINNRHQYKLRKLDDKKELRKTSIIYKRSILESYLKYLGECRIFATPESQANYGKYYLLACLYAPSEALPLMQVINTHYLKLDFHNSEIPIDEMTSILREYINSL